MMGLAFGLALLAVGPSAEARASDPACVHRSSSMSWQSDLASANTALGKALADIKKARYVRATNQLRKLRRKTQTAHTAAAALIGLPPTDPESDDPPGVAAVLRVGGFEHRVTSALVPLFSDRQGRHVVRPMAHGVNQADACRMTMLAQVIALNPGVRDDYVDGLSDTLPSYQRELTAIAAQLAGHGVTTAGRTALTKAQLVVSETRRAMNSVFGGGERSPETR